MIRFILRHYHAHKWRKKAQVAIGRGQATTCRICDKHIIPGDFVAKLYGTDGKSLGLVHAGFHFTLDTGAQMEFCETAAVGSGVWDGKEVKPVT